MTIEVELPTAEATRAWGRALAGLLRAGDLVILVGELGAGKTTLVQGLAAALNVAGSVASPTFIIARQHRPLGDGPWLIHADAYRLDSFAELDALDLDTSLDQAVTVVEWGQGLVEQLAQDYLVVELRRPPGALPSDSQSPEDSGMYDAEPRQGLAHGVGERWAGIDLPGLP
ncbi:MAG: tRNA (adenosine(37)-N6)-threonylcarbamoyltransferase complex ATPase subunit type 1 TsaE [Micrococcales bacterium]|nr:tRNA (adenosine(37)-N6)-threonylcarbamoyltransferase complex ATPase subunit type 1 TsaE [Micrococcales bacterium]